MNKTKTTLILGAGASVTYGYPTGSELRQAILKLADDKDFIEMVNGSSEIKTNTTISKQFFTAFLDSSAESIDNFLARNVKFMDFGKATIAKVLLGCELTSNLYDYEKNPKLCCDNWYSYLLNELTADNDWDKFDPSWLSIITFNYDRSLEFFLSNSLQSRYGKSKADVEKKLTGLKIQHVYGDLGVDIFDQLSYGQTQVDSALLLPAIEYAIKQIKIIEGDRAADEYLSTIQQTLREADRIGFLGFGFDQINVSRLNAAGAFAIESPPKRIAATTIGMKDAEIIRIKRWLFGKENHLSASNAKFLDIKCRALLRETLLLDPSYC